jgi:hypothetical protein
MTLTVDFKNRDSSERTVWPWKAVEVVRYSKASFGGPKKAILRAYGSTLDLWEFMEMLRCPTIITHKERAKGVWWGEIKKVTVYAEGEKRTASIDGMANNVRVGYTLNNKDYRTGWATNADSIAEYGTKDLMVTAKDRTDTQAQNLRDTELARRKYPVISRPVDTKRRGEYAEIECRGWWDTLGDRYYSQDEGQEAYTDLDSYFGREIGEDRRPQCAQAFQLSSDAGWDCDTIWVRLRKYGSPTDNVVLRLKADDGGVPAAGDLATCTLAHGGITSYMDWVECTLSGTVSLALATTYWISLEKSGAISASNCYIVGGNASRGYENGDFYLYWTDLSKWKEKTTMNMNFRVTGKSATTLQIDTLENDIAEFIVDCTIIDASGVETPQYRDGDNTAKFELEELLNLGTSNNLRLLARILENRWMEVYEEPNVFEEDYSQDVDGVIKDQYDAVVHPSDCPVGVWMKTESTIPSSVDTSKLMNADYLFVEEAEYRPDREEYKILKTRDIDDLQSLFGISDG